MIHQILRASDLYAVLDVDKKCDANIMRRAYMKRCKACHPEYVFSSLVAINPLFCFLIDLLTLFVFHPSSDQLSLETLADRSSWLGL